MRNSCKSSSPWDKAILPRHEVDDAVIGDRSCAHRFTHFRLSISGLGQLVCFASAVGTSDNHRRIKLEKVFFVHADRARRPADLRTPAQGRAARYPRHARLGEV
jgi:hypothetical protein